MRCMKTVWCAVGALAVILFPGVAPGDDSLQRAISLAAEQRYPEARKLLDPLLEREPGHPRARLLHGVLRAREGRNGEAIDIFEALRRDHPDMSEPYNNLAVLYALQGRLDDARTILLAILERQPDAVIYANLGDVYTKLARRAYQQARESGADGGAGPARKTDASIAILEPSGGASGTESPGIAPEPRKPVTTQPTVVAAARNQGTGSSGTQEAAAAGTVPAASATGSMSAAFCTYAGGFQDRHAVADAALWLQSYGAEVLEVRHEERRIASSYRVYLPPFANPEDAAAKLREIRDRGVRDVAIIRDGDLANGISFGVYSKAENMQRRVAEIDQLGYAARSRAADAKTVTEYVLKARASGAPDTLDAAWTSRFPEHTIQLVGCG